MHVIFDAVLQEMNIQIQKDVRATASTVYGEIWTETYLIQWERTHIYWAAKVSNWEESHSFVLLAWHHEFKVQL